MLKSNPLRFLATLAFSGVVVASSACSMDGSMAPALSAPSASFAKGLNPGVGNKPDLGVNDSASFAFRIDLSRPQQLVMGVHQLDIPANAVCNLTTSGYGASYWDTPCTAQTGMLTITAKVKGTASGYPRIDFEPALRFAPSKSPTLSMFVKHANGSDAATWKILYCASSAVSSCVDEGQPTSWSFTASLLSRPIKHFSGYLVAE